MESLGISAMGDPVDVPGDTFIVEQRQPKTWEKAELWPSGQEAREGEWESCSSGKRKELDVLSWTHAVGIRRR